MIRVRNVRLQGCFLMTFGLLSFDLPPVAQGEVISWMRQFGTSGSDFGTGVCPDGAGGVYLSGRLRGPISDVGFLRRYDAAGHLTWNSEFEYQYPSDVSIDPSGTVFLSGNGTAGAFLKSFDASGTLNWTSYFESTTEAVSSDGNGNAYVAGGIASTIGEDFNYYDITLHKFDRAGTLVWSKIIDKGLNERSHDVQADIFGNVYISGTSNLMAISNALLLKIDAAGNEMWTRLFGLTNSGGFPANEQGLGVATDGFGNIYMTGYSAGVNNFGSPEPIRAYLNKYDPAGNLVWQQFTTKKPYVSSSGVAVDDFNNVYIAGEIGDRLGSNLPRWVFVSKYDSAGNLLWTNEIGEGQIESRLAMAADKAGNVFITGQTYGNLAMPNAGEADVFVLKLQDVPEPNSLLLSFVALAITSQRRRQHS
jgi:hypothetical protein